MAQSPFTAVADLTEAMVIEWAKANHPAEHMQEVITRNINDKITPKSEDVAGISWLTPASTTTPPAI